MRVRLALVLVGLLGLLLTPGMARAQPSPATPGAPYVDGQSGRFTLDGEWLMRADPSGAGFSGGYAAQTDTGSWTPVRVPSVSGLGDYSTAAFNGTINWYRRDFTVPPSAFTASVPGWARSWIVRFESVNYRANVWINGVHVGAHTGMNLPFEVNLGRSVHAGVNRLVVAVDNRRLASDIPPGPGAGWWNYNGILRPVILRRVQVADLAQVSIRPQLPCPRCAADILASAVVNNPTAAAQRVILSGRFGAASLDFGTATIPAHGSWMPTARALLPAPHLWRLGDPYLYRAALTLTDTRGRPLAGWTQLSGVRSIAVSPAGQLQLNGRDLRLRGAEIREQAPESGTAPSGPQLAALVDHARALGATIIRGDPFDPRLEELADRDGMLIWADINVNQQVSQSELTEPAFLASARQMLQDDIAANGNHPSVGIWSIANELPTPPPDSEAAYVRQMVALAHRLDPTRPVGMAIADWPGVPCQSAYAPLDVIGINEYFGWFDAGGGTTDDRDQLSGFLNSLRTCYPAQGLFVTEFGFDANRVGPADERGTYAFQTQAVTDHARVLDSKPWLSGAIYFPLQDAAALPGYSGGDPHPNPPIVAKGLIDQQGNLKPAFDALARWFRADRARTAGRRRAMR